MGTIKKSVGIALIALSSLAHAQFTGHKLQLRYLFPDQSSEILVPQTAIVGEGVEFPNAYYEHVNADVSSSTITLGFPASIEFNGTEFNGLEFSDIDGTIPKITGVTISGSTTTPGFEPSKISFDENHIWFNFGGQKFPSTTKLIFDVQFDVPKAPEPIQAVTIPTVGDKELTVHWTAPADNGSPITKYTVTGVPGGTCTSAIDPPATTPDTSCTVTGLTNGTAYKFTVVATNANGDSVASPESAEAVPSADIAFVGGGPTITLAGGVVAAPYSQPLQVVGGLPPYTFSVVGELPPGLALDSATGVVSGTPTTPGSYTFSVGVSDTVGRHRCGA